MRRREGGCAEDKLRVLSVFGTRPEAIKMAPLIAELNTRPYIQSIVCVTAQHREMLDMVNRFFRISPDYDLDVMRPQQGLCSLAARILSGMEGVIAQAQPDIVLVHGDTTTTAVAALAAFYCGIPVGHVEAGLRSYDKRSPFPEEGNRLIAGRLSDLHFAPTPTNAQYLCNEGITQGVFVTGNTVIDALAYTVQQDYVFSNTLLAGFLSNYTRVIAVTAHRRENIGDPLHNICKAIALLAKDNSDVGFAFPVHPNPAVEQIVVAHLSDLSNVILLPPIDTADMHNLLARCAFVMTDSGGLQEEAPALGKPVLVLRRETERPEAIQAGTALLCGTETDPIRSAAQTLIDSEAAYNGMARAVNPYGDGRASVRIADAIAYSFGHWASPPEPFGGGLS